jgi:alkylation response protein AidB-like acyl-CoA dehydrogenase
MMSEIATAGNTILDARADTERFRALVRDWLARTVPANWREDQAQRSEAEQFAFQRWWFDQLASIGMTTAHWPRQWGGEDMGVAAQIVFYEELARARAPSNIVFVSTLYQMPATLFAAGTPAQRERYIEGAKGGDHWCQGFSEPNAGSDLASLRTTAVRDGDSYVVNGQKVWTSFGQFAKHCLLLARTDPSQPKHKGISMFVMDMDSPGVTLRPIRQMTGQSEFNEMFLEDVRIPAANLLGEENAGWTVAQSTLSAERGLIIFEQSERLRRFIDDLFASLPTWLKDAEHRRALIRVHSDVLALTLMIRQMLGHNEDDGDMSAQHLPMMIKLHYAVLLQRLGALLVKVNGIDGQLLHPDVATGGVPGGNWMLDYLASWNWTISGGTNEVIRNIISERLLGLPR